MANHNGHRNRLRQRFLTEGLDRFTDVQILELLLFYCIPRRDTNELAHSLLERFGSLSQVMDAPVEELCTVPGVSENTAALLTMIPQAGRCYLRDRTVKTRILPTLDSCAQYLQPYFFGKNVETVYLLCLDAKCRLLCCRKLSEGDVNSTELPIRRVVEAALAARASSVLLAHNHPGGVAIPSHADIRATMNVAAALRAVDVQLIDHIVLCDDDYVSLMQSGYLVPDTEE